MHANIEFFIHRALCVAYSGHSHPNHQTLLKDIVGVQVNTPEPVGKSGGRWRVFPNEDVAKLKNLQLGVVSPAREQSRTKTMAACGASSSREISSCHRARDQRSRPALPLGRGSARSTNSTMPRPGAGPTRVPPRARQPALLTRGHPLAIQT